LYAQIIQHFQFPEVQSACMQPTKNTADLRLPFLKDQIKKLAVTNLTSPQTHTNDSITRLINKSDVPSSNNSRVTSYL